jgi:hypothetical protein
MFNNISPLNCIKYRKNENLFTTFNNKFHSEFRINNFHEQSNLQQQISCNKKSFEIKHKNNMCLNSYSNIKKDKNGNAFYRERTQHIFDYDTRDKKCSAEVVKNKKESILSQQIYESTKKLNENGLSDNKFEFSIRKMIIYERKQFNSIKDNQIKINKLLEDNSCLEKSILSNISKSILISIISNLLDDSRSVIGISHKHTITKKFIKNDEFMPEKIVRNLNLISSSAMTNMNIHFRNQTVKSNEEKNDICSIELNEKSTELDTFRGYDKSINSTHNKNMYSLEFDFQNKSTIETLKYHFIKDDEKELVIDSNCMRKYKKISVTQELPRQWKVGRI